jgi:protein TonB
MTLFLPAAMTAALLSSPDGLAATHPQSCTTIDRPAHIVRSVEPQYPPIAKLQNLTGTSFIRVDLSATGRALGANVAVSSGSILLDRAALEAVKSSVYEPETRSCTAIPGSYAIEVEFPG